MKLKVLGIVIVSCMGWAFSSVDVMEWTFPSYFPEPVYNFKENPLTTNKVALGKLLFYDPILSKDGSISCADCHSPYNAFAHTDHDLSHGIHDSIGTRNAPALFNLAWQNAFMQDGAIQNLDMQALAPISHPAEMDEDIKHVISKLNARPFYQNAFYQAWGDSLATGEHFLKSIAQFELTLVSSTSKYDAVKLDEEKFSEQEMAGYSLFQVHCNSCHTEPLFSNYQFVNNGLSIDSTLNDLGRYAITTNPKDSLKFKVPSLRNLSYTYPYMHDGRFNTLHEVLNHYTHIKPDFSSAPELQNPLPLNANDKADIIAFLLTLNDPTFIFNPSNKYPKELKINNNQ